MYNGSMTPGEVLEYFQNQYFVEKNIESILGCLTEDVRWLGAADADDMLLNDRDGVRRMYELTRDKLPEDVYISATILDEQVLRAQATVFARQEIISCKTNRTVLRQRLQLSFRREDGLWKICCLHGSVYYDLVKQDRVLSKMKSSQLELKNVVNAIPGGIAVYRLRLPDSLRLEYFSDGVAELTGYSREEYDELLAVDPFGAVYTDDRPALQNTVVRGILSGERSRLTFRCFHKNGSLLWASIVVQAAGMQDGDYLGHAVFADAPKQYGLFKSIMDETETCIYVVDTETHRMYYANNAMQKLLRFEGKDISEGRCYEQLFGKTQPCLGCSISTGEELQNEERCLPEFGNRRVLVRDRFINWMGRAAMIRYAVDISEQRAAEEKLRNEQERYRLIVENTGTVVFDWDLENHTTYTSGDFSRYIISRQPVDNIVNNKVPAEAVHPEDLKLLQQFGRDAEMAKPFAETTLRAHMVDGSYRWTTVSVNSVTDAEGRRIRVIGTIRDVNDKQAAVYDRQLSLMRMNTIIEDTGILYWELDVKARRAAMGASTRSALGVQPVLENYPEPLLERGVIPKLYAEECRQLHRAVEKGAEYAEVRLPVILADGDERWFRVRYHSLFSKGRRPDRAIGTALDITEQVIAERQYRELAAMQDAISKHAYDFFVFNLSKNRVDNARGPEQDKIDYLQYSYDEFVAMSENRIVGAEEKKKYRRTFARARLMDSFESGTGSVSCVVRFRTEEQKEIWLEISISLRKNPTSGDIIAFSYGLDVSRQRMEQEVIEAVSTYDFDLIALVDTNADEITMFKKQDDRFAHLNSREPQSFSRTLALSAEAYVVPEDRQMFLENSSAEHIRRELKNKSSFEFTFRFYGENGAIRIKKTRYADYKMSGGVLLLTRIDVTDVVQTREKQNSALLAALDSARQANAAKTVFLSAMSHDIRTPLNAIAGMTELAINDSENTRQVTESLATIKEASDHLLSLINSILEMSRIESGKMVTAEENFRQSEVLDKLYQLTLPMLQSKGQQLIITRDIAHDKCTGDALRLNRILENLLSNASKFTAPGNVITLDCQELSGKERTELVRFRYAVTDTGIGMSREQLECIFEPFYRVGTVTQTGVEGTGLGLAIVKSTVELLGGTVEAKSTPGEGSCFIVELPFRITEGTPAREPAKEKTLQLEDGKGLAGISILLVEDHPINSIVATRMLEKGGAVVALASNGLEGFERFRDSERDEFDAVLMDIQMPVMNGYEATQAIRECRHPRAKTVPIIAMTANAFAEDVKKAIGSGMNEHISKPVEMARLYDVLGHLERYETRDRPQLV